MRRTSHYQLFDPGPYFSALALVRIPSSPSDRFTGPAPDDAFGTGFFVTTSGTLLTAAHNLTRDGTPDGELLPWVWVCTFDHVTRDWTDIAKVSVDPSLVARALDAAVLRVPLVKMIAPLRIGAQWEKGDSIAILGFQPDDNRPSKFDVHWMPCSIPPSFPVAPLDVGIGVREPALRLVPLDGALGKGISGGPALNTDCDGNPAIAVVKAEIEAVELRPAEVKTTALYWIRNLIEQSTDAGAVSWSSPRVTTGRVVSSGRQEPTATAATPSTPVSSPLTVPQRAGALRDIVLVVAGVLVCATAFLPAWSKLDVDFVGPARAART